MYDLFIIGGGINGCGIAADAALRGLKVILCEQADLASYTSSYSSKLIHGGLRYLEYYEFTLVRKALHERELLLKLAPHLIHPLPTLLPHNQHCRPSWMIRLGLVLYDVLAGKHSMPRTQFLRLTSKNTSLQKIYQKGYLYYDGQVDDSRLVVSNALQAKLHGANIHTQAKVLKAERKANLWHIQVQHDDGTKAEYQSKVLVNASGPFVNQVIKEVCQDETAHHIRLVQGSHIIIKKPKRFFEENAYILQLADQRIIFVIPYLEDFLLIGTTDVDYQGDPAKAEMSETERDYLIQHVNEYFNWQITAQDLVHHFAGVRPLLADEHANAAKVTRDYKFEVHDQAGQTPIVHIFGGKITTYRKLAQEVVDQLKPYFPNLPATSTASIPLPGGDIENFSAFLRQVYQDFPALPQNMLRRQARAYGTRIYQLLKNIKNIEAMGEHFGATLYQRELDFLKKEEWAKNIEDILWRRTKIGLSL